MNNNSYLCRYINSFSDWDITLKEAPYFLKIKREGDLAIFNYDVTKSDFSNKIVREARGIIIDTKRKEVVCWPFTKFHNYGEKYADNIDWASARVQEKVDGSIMKVWFNAEGEMQVSTNGCINAKDANTPSGATYLELFMKAWFNVNFTKELDKDYTYIFELVSPENQVVVRYPQAKVYHLGTRNNKTGEEVEVDLGIDKPKSYSLHSLEECIDAASKLNSGDEVNDEGFVVVDKDWHRVKIKSPLYVAAHHLRTNDGFLTYSRIYDLNQSGELGEYLNYFPDQKLKVLEYEFKVKKLEIMIYHQRNILKGLTEKEMIDFINKKFPDKYKFVGWAYKNGQTLEETMSKMSKNRLLELIADK